MKLLSIHLPSNKPHHFRRFVENLVTTAADPTCFEVVVKIDTGDHAMAETVAAIRRDLAVNLTVVVSERFPSYFHTYLGFAECFRASDPEYYFCWHVNDEILIETTHWDTILARYVDFFPDRIFRLKVHPQKMFYNFFDIRESCLYADYPIVPRRWLDATEGWGDCHGPDLYQECIAIWLARYGHHRNIPLLDIRVGGDEAGQNISPETALRRAQGTCLAWDNTLAAERQEQMARAARRLQMVIRAHTHGLAEYELRDDRQRKAVALMHRGHVYARVFYAVDQVALRFRNFNDIAHRQWPFSLWGKPWPFKAAVYAYRVLHGIADVVIGLVKIPVGLMIGVPWPALVAATVHSEAPGMQMVVNGWTRARERLVKAVRG